MTFKEYIDMFRPKDEVTHSTGVVFTPGVPTEDGWYVVRVKYDGVEYYDTIQQRGEYVRNGGTILSHAKLPEL